MSGEARSRTILVADDDEMVRRLLVRALVADGYRVLAAADGNEATNIFVQQPVDLVLSDIDMPGCNGVELLHTIRARDLDTPVVLLTGRPTIETAISAVEHGASRYLTKPVDLHDLRTTIRRLVHAGDLARARRQLVEIVGDSALQISDVAGLEGRFDTALAELFMLWQPIVRWSDRSTFAYEALARSTEPTIASAEALFDAADRLGRTADIGRRIRRLCAQAIDSGHLMFINVHPDELLDDALFQREAPLTRAAERVVLEITERARLENVGDVPGRVDRLRKLGFRIAIDDIGAGYAGLTSFAALEPDFMKLDGALVRKLHASRTKMRLVGAMIRACNDLGVQVIGEGVETIEERDALLELGCDLLQGYLFARPALPFPPPTF